MKSAGYCNGYFSVFFYQVKIHIFLVMKEPAVAAVKVEPSGRDGYVYVCVCVHVSIYAAHVHEWLNVIYTSVP